ncbi:MAG TPA: cytidylate kinase-like family protein [Gemmataceae bacterium]|jgi:cytidylate kinase
MSAYKTSSERMAEVVARARRRWQTQQRMPEPDDALAPPAPRAFTIAISREAGANGSAVGRLLGERLGWPVYDYELVERIADDMGLRSTLLESVDETRMSWLQECVASFSSGRSVTESAYVRHLVQTLLTLALHGECILVGRGANVVAPPATTFRVRLVAPLRERILTVQKRRSLSFEEAQRWVEKTDHARAAFIKDHFHKQADDPYLHDLVLNTSRFSIEACAEIIIDALHRMEAQVQKSAETSVPVG